MIDFESIFSTLPKHTSEYARKKQEMYEKREMLEAKFSSDKLLSASKGMIPYGGSLIYGILSSDPSKFSYPEYRPYNGWPVFISNEDSIVTNIKDTWNKGVTKSGQVFYTTDFGLVFLRKNFIDKKEIQEIDGWLIPSYSWLENSHRTMEYFSYITYDYKVITENSPEKIRERKEEADKREILANDARVVRSTKLLMDCNEVIDDISIVLADFIINYDKYWEYSDDHAFCIRYSSKIKIVKSHLENYPKLNAYFTNI